MGGFKKGEPIDTDRPFVSPGVPLEVRFWSVSLGRTRKTVYT